MDADLPLSAASATGFPWLSLIVLLPAAAALLMPLLPGDEETPSAWPRNLALGVLTIDFALTQKNEDAWNYVHGFNWDVNRNWALQAEVGFGGSREHLIGSAVYRW